MIFIQKDFFKLRKNIHYQCFADVPNIEEDTSKLQGMKTDNGKVVPYHLYCVNHMESFENEQLISKPEYIICTPPEPEDHWLIDVGINLYSALNIISMIFLALLFVLIFKTQRDKLFG